MTTALGQCVLGGQVIDFERSRGRARGALLLVAICVGLVATGFGIVLPVFARRLAEMGYGVGELALLTSAFAIAQFAAAPVLGAMADRFGRRPVILLALTGHAIGNAGYLLVADLGSFIALRVVQGVLTAGMFPAAMGVVADRAREQDRARYVGLIMAAFGVGFVFGPIVGGVLYDGFGFAAPFGVSAAVAVIATVLALVLLPESRTPRLRNRDKLRAAWQRGSRCAIAEAIPKPVSIFAVLLLVTFTLPFAFTFAEPQMVFYFYDVLDWNTVKFGLVVGTYGVALMITQLTLSGASDRLGRRWVIAFGMLCAASIYLGLVAVSDFALVLMIAALAGFGEGLATPAVNAFFLDMTAPMHRARIMGLRSSAASVGSALGPLLAVAVADAITPAALFLSAAAVVAVVALVAAMTLQARDVHEVHRLSVDAEALEQRSLTAGATLRGLVVAANRTRAP